MIVVDLLLFIAEYFDDQATESWGDCYGLSGHTVNGYYIYIACLRVFSSTGRRGSAPLNLDQRPGTRIRRLMDYNM